jgi:hypothetical protein
MREAESGDRCAGASGVSIVPHDHLIEADADVEPICRPDSPMVGELTIARSAASFSHQ